MNSIEGFVTKGTGFSPYIKFLNIIGALAPEGISHNYSRKKTEPGTRCPAQTTIPPTSMGLRVVLVRSTGRGSISFNLRPALVRLG